MGLVTFAVVGVGLVRRRWSCGLGRLDLGEGAVEADRLWAALSVLEFEKGAEPAAVAVDNPRNAGGRPNVDGLGVRAVDVIVRVLVPTADETGVGILRVNEEQVNELRTS